MKRSDGAQSRIICSKTRVSPANSLTIPRLELLSALLLARLIDNITRCLSKELDLSPPFCFLDSKVAYYWIRGEEKSWRPFIQNRVNEIRRLVPVGRWRHCVGTQNPADIPSRGQPLAELVNNHLWFTGPDWLSIPVDDKQPALEPPMPPECTLELKKSPESRHTLLSNNEITGVTNLLDIQSYSDVNRLFRVTAYVLLFIRKLQKRDQDSPPTLTKELLNKAETLWIQSVQSKLELEVKFKSWKAQLGLFTDEMGLMRCRGRLKNADLPYTTQFPLILPRDHTLMCLLIKQAHERVFHNGVKETLTQLRSKYWIIKGRSSVKSFIWKCSLCRRMEGPHYNVPPPPPLPTYKVQEAPPFSHCGVDYAKPQDGEKINRHYQSVDLLFHLQYHQSCPFRTCSRHDFKFFPSMF